MRQSDKRDYKIIAIMLLVALFTTVLALTAKSETILEYTACSITKCTTQKLYEDNSKFFECQIHGQRIVMLDMERKLLRHHFIRKWSCGLGARYERL